VRDTGALRRAFAYHPAYYHFDEQALNYVEHGPQNSRGFRALKVWLALQHVGAAGYRRMIGDDIALSRAMAAAVDRHPALEVVTQSLSITTFRYVPADLQATRTDAGVAAYLDTLNAAILDALARRPDASDELFMVSSGENPTVADISRAAGDAVGRPVRPIRLPPVFWRALRAIAWNPLVRKAMPQAVFVAYWRLTLIIDDGFWCDPAKLLALYNDPVVLLLEGLRRTLEG